MQKLLVIFSHGKESGPWGSKIRALADVAERLGAQVMSVDYREHTHGTPQDQNAEGEADRRVDQLLSITLPMHSQLVLVGSSMGAYVSTVQVLVCRWMVCFCWPRLFICLVMPTRN